MTDHVIRVLPHQIFLFFEFPDCAHHIKFWSREQKFSPENSDNHSNNCSLYCSGNAPLEFWSHGQLPQLIILLVLQLVLLLCLYTSAQLQHGPSLAITQPYSSSTPSPCARAPQRSHDLLLYIFEPL